MLIHFSQHPLEMGSGPRLLKDSSKMFTGMNYKYPAELGHKPVACHSEQVHYLWGSTLLHL